MLKNLRWPRFGRIMASVMALTTAGTGIVTLAATPSSANDVIVIGETFSPDYMPLRSAVINACNNDSDNCTLSGSLTNEWVKPTISRAFVGQPKLLDPVNDQYPVQQNCTTSETSFRYQTQYMENTQLAAGPTGGVEFGPSVFKISLGASQTTTYVKEKTISINMEVPMKPGETGFAFRAFALQKYSGWLWYHRVKPASPDVRVWVEYVVAVPDGTDGVYGRGMPTTRPQTADEAAACRVAQTSMIKAPLTASPSTTPTPLKTPTAPMSSQKIAPGTTLRAGWWTQGPYTRLVMQGDGNLVMYRLRDGRAIWSTHTPSNPGAYAIMQNDGNLVIYTSTGGPGKGGALWATGTNNTAQ
ncbi:hypothetical protein [Streptomyces sp. NPDC055709]